MSATCSQQYTIEQGGVSAWNAYWSMEDTGITLVDQEDEVIGYLLRPNNLIYSVPGGIKNNCVWFESVALNAKLELVHTTVWPPVFYPEMKVNPNGFSAAFWARVGGLTYYPLWFKPFELTSDLAGFQTVYCTLILYGDGTGLAQLWIKDFGNFNIPITFTAGDWTFFHLYFDLSSHVFGIQINDGAPTTQATGAASYPETDATQLVISRSNGFGDTYVDEFGLILNGPMTKAQADWLYNSGAGRTWPEVQTLP